MHVSRRPSALCDAIGRQSPLTSMWLIRGGDGFPQLAKRLNYTEFELLAEWKASRFPAYPKPKEAEVEAERAAEVMSRPRCARGWPTIKGTKNAPAGSAGASEGAGAKLRGSNEFRFPEMHGGMLRRATGST
jgi:hypothetical protein